MPIGGDRKVDRRPGDRIHQRQIDDDLGLAGSEMSMIDTVSLPAG
jgi:hypothetical protein